MFETCAIRRSGPVSCTDPEGSFEVDVQGAIDLAVGYQQGCVVTAAGAVLCFDSALTFMAARRPPVVVRVPGLDDAVAVAAGMVHRCALRRSGSVECWGQNESGTLGDGTLVSRTAPAAVVDLAGAVEIAAGTHASCARLRGRTVSCWGSLAAASVGKASTTRPVRIAGWEGALQLSLNAGCNAGTLLCARLADGTVSCFGDNDVGQLGDGTRTPRDRPAPVQGLRDAVDLAVGCSHACALRAGGEVVCWGEGETLGFGRDHDQLVPAPARDL